MKRKRTISELLIRLFFASMVLGLVVVVLAPLFRHTGDVNTIYGRRRSQARTSVNGTSVLADMFSQAGCKVTTWHQFSPRLIRSEAIVWTPDSFELPSSEQIDFLESDWLSADYRSRTLIYVGRDYNAAIDYWNSQVGQHDGEKQLKARKKLAESRSDHAYARSLTGTQTDSEWFNFRSTQVLRRVVPSEGPWAEFIDPAKADIHVAGKIDLAPAKEAQRLEQEVLLGSEETPLVVRLTNELDWPGSQVIIVINGFSIFNLPLVNHEHRKIAGQLIEACGNPNRVTFLETGPGGSRISRRDPKAYSGFEALTVWPINSILLHLIVAGILFCLMVFPIFGRPRNIEEDSPSDFTKHIRAIGDLLALAGDREGAIAQIQQYRGLNLETSARTNAHSVEPEPTPGNPFKTA